jgi:hypothetical protein
VSIFCRLFCKNSRHDFFVKRFLWCFFNSYRSEPPENAIKSKEVEENLNSATTVTCRSNHDCCDIEARSCACARMHGAPAKNPVSVCGRGTPPPIDPEIHPNRPRKQGTKHERNNLAARSVLTWYSSSQCPNYAVDFRPCRTSTPVPVTSYRSYSPAFHSLPWI